jgi:hypothetical protein
MLAICTGLFLLHYFDLGFLVLPASRDLTAAMHWLDIGAILFATSLVARFTFPPQRGVS